MSKKDQAHIGDFGHNYSNKRHGEANEDRKQPAQVEEWKPASKPILKNSNTKKTTIINAVEVNEK